MRRAGSYRLLALANGVPGAYVRNWGGWVGQKVARQDAKMIPEPKPKRQQDDREREERERARQEEQLDEALKNTFPASDPVSAEQP
jgi:hypothetical protein